MKKTKEKIECKDFVIEFESNLEALVFRKIATGRKFFKIGERVIDICNQEIERYNYEHSGFFNRLFKKSKFENKKEKYMLESRISNLIRATSAYCIRRDEENDELILEPARIKDEVREFLLKAVREYEKKNKNSDKTAKNEKDEKNSKVIDIRTKKRA